MQSLLMKQLCYEGSHSSSPCCKNTTFSAHGTPPISIHAFRRPPRSTEHRRIELPKVRAAPPSPTFGRKRRPSKGAPPSGTSTAPTLQRQVVLASMLLRTQLVAIRRMIRKERHALQHVRGLFFHHAPSQRFLRLKRQWAVHPVQRNLIDGLGHRVHRRAPHHGKNQKRK